MIITSLHFAILALQCAISSLTNWPPWQGNSAFFSCDPFLDCQTAGVGSKVPDPENCHNYYICMNSDGEPVPSDVTFACPDWQYFDHSTGSCMTALPPCTNECYKFCYLECTTNYQLVVYPGDCTKYYKCYTGDTKVEMDCPPNYPYFDGRECTNNPYLCCFSCIPYCRESFIEIEDPLDCHSFYICVETGVPSESNHHACPDGGHFDSATNMCVSGTECTSICNNSLTTSVIATTPNSFETTNIGNTGPAKLL